MATEKTSAQKAEEIAGVHPMRVSRTEAEHRHVRGGYDNGGQDGMGDQFPDHHEEVVGLTFVSTNPPQFDSDGWPSR